MSASVLSEFVRWHLSGYDFSRENRSEAIDTYKYVAKQLDKELAAMVKRAGGNPAPFENCVLAATELAFMDCHDDIPVSVKEANNEYGFERVI